MVKIRVDLMITNINERVNNWINQIYFNLLYSYNVQQI